MLSLGTSDFQSLMPVLSPYKLHIDSKDYTRPPSLSPVTLFKSSVNMKRAGEGGAEITCKSLPCLCL